MTELRRRMIQDMELRGFSPKTRKAYVDAVKGLAGFHHRSPDKLGDEEIRRFFLHLVGERHANARGRTKRTDRLAYEKRKNQVLY